MSTVPVPAKPDNREPGGGPTSPRRLTVEPFTEAQGSVAAFDEHRGYGMVQAPDGTELFFHCTAVADGSRTIAVGTEVRFGVEPGRLGRWEATGVRAEGSTEVA